jgi:hypothetical protein
MALMYENEHAEAEYGSNFVLSKEELLTFEGTEYGVDIIYANTRDLDDAKTATLKRNIAHHVGKRMGLANSNISGNLMVPSGTGTKLEFSQWETLRNFNP